ncbi:ATP-dependent DNA helicase RecG [Corynebacterium uterequi]|uniref:ATP-dependent DNA helicase RecG n=1 Tax=Corynebacterium uterequi TaxID=1072256 RepID=A0A0G3HG98_9CORY|nr:ATP-dependent DNA helicase RecG [Corynebacterium uterequi]AKK10978.1 ATP-dependent DNA helicase RecG [Corynebacterium uterequi]
MLGWRDDRALADVLPAREATALKKAFGYTHCWELLEHFPRRYVRHGDASSLLQADDGDVVSVIATVVGHSVYHRGPKKTVYRFQLVEESGHPIDASFFNGHYAGRALADGSVAAFTGKVTFYRGQPQLQHPDFFVIRGPGAGQQGTGSLKALSTYGRLRDILNDHHYLPVYPATSTITTWRIMGAVIEVLDSLPAIPEPLGTPPAGLPSLDQAVRLIHQPDRRGPDGPLTRLKYNEALSLALVMALRRADHAERRAPSLPPVDAGQRAQLLGSLPYSLTEGQHHVLGHISDDLAGTVPMSRLLQGEVGSGKTVVALLAMLQAVDAGAQCAMLVPTEVLAIQHARSLTSQLLAAGCTATVVALTGSMPTAAKRQALLDIVSGQVDIVIGTHALIQETVEFFDLGLVVVDEQHRFGVEQRDQLRTKGREGKTPHLLVMTATPIPRTIAMTVFGDLAVSTLRELPGGRKPIQSSVVPESRPAWTRRAYERIAEEVADGHQAYVVCPRIDGEGGVLETYEYLSTVRYPDLRVGLLHGRLRGEDKDAVMKAFAAGEIDILVATTVIEVGVDVANATVMLIREAENFGVSQLHQLRGRVGRGGHASLCLLHTLADDASPAFARVSAVAATSDGFELATVDLAHRQEGDILGTSQSGREKSVKLLSLIDDYLLIERANADAAALVERDRDLAKRLAAEIAENEREYLNKS